MINLTTRSEEERMKDALARVYHFLLKLAEEKENAPKPSVVKTDESSEPLQQNTPSEV
jgi:hypothetical protein